MTTKKKEPLVYYSQLPPTTQLTADTRIAFAANSNANLLFTKDDILSLLATLSASYPDIEFQVKDVCGVFRMFVGTYGVALDFYPVYGNYGR